MWWFIIPVLVVLGIGVFLILLRRKKLVRQLSPIKLTQSASTLSACVEVLQKHLYMTNFAPVIEQNVSQIERFYKKRETIRELLSQKFSISEMSYQKFDGVLSGVEQVIYINIRSILNKIAAFDYEEYSQLDSLEWNKDELAAEKMGIYQTYMQFVAEATRDNEEIILRIDKLLLEVSQFNSQEIEDIINMPAMIELDKLIKNAKLYR